MLTPTKRTGALKKYLIIILGASILSFGLYNLHERTGVTEGGVLGTVLLLQHWLNLSPAITNPLLDLLCYLLAFKFLGKSFAKYAIVASVSFALSHGLWERFPPLLPDFTDFPLMAALLGALFVGVGVGLVVRVGGACGGDDALALSLGHVTGLPIARCYLISDLAVLVLSLSYIPLERIAYSLVTVTLSSFLIGRIQVAGARHAQREPLPDNA
ncbi:MAG: YitT family protein [Oscillospiraceae bacterium]